MTQEAPSSAHILWFYDLTWLLVLCLVSFNKMLMVIPYAQHAPASSLMFPQRGSEQGSFSELCSLSQDWNWGLAPWLNLGSVHSDDTTIQGLEKTMARRSMDHCIAWTKPQYKAASPVWWNVLKISAFHWVFLIARQNAAKTDWIWFWFWNLQRKSLITFYNAVSSKIVYYGRSTCSPLWWLKATAFVYFPTRAARP